MDARAGPGVPDTYTPLQIEGGSLQIKGDAGTRPGSGGAAASSLERPRAGAARAISLSCTAPTGRASVAEIRVRVNLSAAALYS